jgi:hypothetical protein
VPADASAFPSDPKPDNSPQLLARLMRTEYTRGAIQERVMRLTLLTYAAVLIAGVSGAQAAYNKPMRFEREGRPMPTDFGTDVANVLMKRRYARDPRTRKINGWGRKWLP